MEAQQEMETVPSSGSEQLNLKILCRQTENLSDILTSSNDSAEAELKNLLQDLKCENIIKQLGFSNLDSLQPQDLIEAYMKDEMEQLHLIEAENSKIYDEMKLLTSVYMEDHIQLERDIQGLKCSIKFLESQGLDKLDLGTSVECSTSSNGNLVSQHEDYEFEILKLERQIEKKKITLSSIEGLNDSLKRVEAVGQIEDMLTSLNVVEFDGNGIRFSLETSIPTLDAFICQQKMEIANNPLTVMHELFVEVYDGTLELRNVEIFPNDVFIGEIFDDAKSSWKLFPSLSLQGITSSLHSLVQRVEDRIRLCTLRRLIVKDANNSRHSFEYSDRDGTVVTVMASGTEAVIKLPYCWPLVNSSLKLISLKTRNNIAKELSLTSCQVEELGSSLGAQTQQNLLSFVDAIEETLARR